MLKKLQAIIKYKIPSTKYLLTIVTGGIITFLAFSFFSSNTAEAGWYNTSWQYRVRLTIDNTGSADANKKVKFDIDTSSLISADKMQADCGDSRFTDINGTLLRYYIDTSGGACNSASTDYYVLVPTIHADDTIIYHYYGNPSADNGTEASQFSEATFSPNSTSSASEEVGPGPVGYWKFDEGYGETIYDSTANVHNSSSFSGTPQWRPDTQCAGKCMYFDGTGDYITIDDSTTLQPGNGSWTINFWAKVPDKNQNGSILGKSQIGGDYEEFHVYISSDQHMTTTGQRMGFSFRQNEANEKRCYTDIDVADNNWHHYSVVANKNADSITIYRDNQPLDWASGGCNNDGAWPTINNTDDLLIGGHAATDLDNLEFTIDELKIYPYARSSAQIKRDYQAGTAEGSSASTGSPSPDTNLTNGLVGWWQMDDPGVDAEGETITDSSGSGNDGTLYGDNSTGDNGSGMNCTAAGKFGTGCNFDGTDDSITADTHTYPASNQYTFSTWVNPDDLSGIGVEILLSLGVNWDTRIGIDKDSDNLFLNQKTSGTAGTWETESNSILETTWNHVAISYDSSSIDNDAEVFINGQKVTVIESSNPTGTIETDGEITLGAQRNSASGFGNHFDGTLDEVRIYNRALSSAEVERLYNFAPKPVVYFDFNENTGTGSDAVKDKSGNGYHGTMDASMTNTSWVPGKFGSALNFDGTDDEVDLGDVLDFIDPQAFTTSLWFNASTIDTGDQRTLLSKWTGTGDDRAFRLEIETDETIEVLIDDTDNGNPTLKSSTTISTGTWYHVSVIVDPANDTAKLYLNGILEDENTSYTGTVGNSSGNWRISNRTSDQFFNGRVDEVRIYNYARTPGQVIEDMNGGHPVGGSPIGSQALYLKFDEGYGDTAYDWSPNGTDGDLAGSGTTCPQSSASACPTWSNDGKFGKALSFDGGDDGTEDYVHLSSYDDPEQVTYSAWIYPTEIGSLERYIFSTNTIRTTVYIENDDDSLAFNYHFNTSSGTWNTPANSIVINQWQHVLVTYDGSSTSNDPEMYINGVKQALTENSTPSGTHSSGSELAIGNRLGASRGFEGLIDEAKIYNTTMTEDQVRVELNQGKSTVFGAGSTDGSGDGDTSADRAYCVPGDSTACSAPIAEYKFDENAGTSTTYDTSGNDINGSLQSITDINWVPGFRGSALDFDGSADYVGLNGEGTALDISGSNAEITVCARFKVDAFSSFEPILSKGDTQYILKVDSSGYIEWKTGGTYFTSDSTISTGKWYHVCAYNDGTNMKMYINGQLQSNDATQSSIGDTAADVWIGRNPDQTSRYFDGQIDEVVVYDYARTPAQIAWEYNRSAPIAWYKFDECASTTLNDWSKDGNGDYNGNNGTIGAGGSGSNSSVGTCNSGNGDEMWDNGSDGRFNASLDFDGTNDYVEVPNFSAELANLDTITMSGWVYPPATPGNHSFYFGVRTNSNADFYVTQLLGSNTLECRFRESGGTTYTASPGPTIVPSQWNHITMVYDGSEVRCYVDAVEQGSVAASGTFTNTGEDLWIGSQSDGAANQLDGKVDDLRIFNTALTDEQIKLLYNRGDAVRFGE